MRHCFLVDPVLTGIKETCSVEKLNSSFSHWALTWRTDELKTDSWHLSFIEMCRNYTAAISGYCQSAHHCQLRLLWDVRYILARRNVWYERRFRGPAVWTQPWNLFFFSMRFLKNHIKTTSVTAATDTHTQTDKPAHTQIYMRADMCVFHKHTHTLRMNMFPG